MFFDDPKLPDEITIKILKNLKPEDLGRIDQVNKYLHNLSHDEAIWWKQIEKFFLQPDLFRKEENDTRSYKDIYLIAKKEYSLAVKYFHDILSFPFSSPYGSEGDFDYARYLDDRIQMVEQISMLVTNKALNYCELIHQFLKIYPDINCKYGGLGMTLLHVTAGLPDCYATPYLLKKEANLNALDGRGETPLLVAISFLARESQEWIEAKEVLSKKALQYGKVMQTLVINGADTDAAIAFVKALEEIPPAAALQVAIEMRDQPEMPSKKIKVDPLVMSFSN